MTPALKKELILINPCLSHPLIRLGLQVFKKRHVPYAFLVLSALAPRDYKIRILNQKMFWHKKDFVCDRLVGITAVTANVCQAYELADRFRKAGSFVVMGGPHVTALPDEALKHCDSVVIGEAESVWADVLKDYENKTFKNIYQGRPLDDFFAPVHDYFLKLNPVLFYHSGLFVGRGCKYRCDFCARPAQALRFIKVSQIIELVKKIKLGVRNPFLRELRITFCDDNIFSSPSHAKELFRRLISLKIRWTSCASVDMAFDDEALRLAKESGCYSLLLGFESIYPEDYGKTSTHRMVSLEDYLEPIKRIKSHGIKIFGAFIIGFDRYSHRDYLKLLWFLIRARFWCAHLTILTPFPGTALFERLKKENRILTYDWSKYDIVQHLVFKPKRMSTASVYLWYSAIRLISALFSSLFWWSCLVAIPSFFISYYLIYFLREKVFY